MKEEEIIIQKTFDFVQEQLAHAEKGHDIWHAHRVWKLASTIAQTEPGDRLIIELSALLHDISDEKFNGGDPELGPELAFQHLTALGLKSSIIEAILNIIRNISFAGGNGEKSYTSPELNIVQDADRLDAMGAIGIARAFHYGGFHNRLLYHPEIPPRTALTKENYRKEAVPTLNHFYEKLLRLQSMMNTPTAKKMGEKRQQVMLDFLDHFLAEWGLKDTFSASSQHSAWG